MLKICWTHLNIIWNLINLIVHEKVLYYVQWVRKKCQVCLFLDFYFLVNVNVYFLLVTQLVCLQCLLVLLLQCILLMYTFLYIRRKYWITENFQWIYMIWDVLNTIWPFLESVGQSQKFCGHFISITNERKLMKLYIHLHL